MSYEEPYNGDYDHQDLFGIGEELWWAHWSEDVEDFTKAYYCAVRVRVLEIIISAHDVKYKVGYVDERYVDDGEKVVAYDDQLYTTKKEAEKFALDHLIYSLDSELNAAQHSADYHTKGLREACTVRDELKSILAGLAAEQIKLEQGEGEQ